MGYYKSAVFESQVASQKLMNAAADILLARVVNQLANPDMIFDSITNLITEEDKTERLEDKLVKTNRSEMKMLLEKIQAEIKQAMRDKAADRLGVLRLIVADIKNEAFKEGKKRTEDEVVMAYHKRLVKAKDEFGSTSEAYLKQLEFEIKVTEEFLPKLMTEDEVREQIKVLAEKGTIDMRSIMPFFKGKADPRIVQNLIKNWSVE